VRERAALSELWATGADSARYQQLIPRIRELVEGTVPHESIVLVVSKGDDDLMHFTGRSAWHFPRDEKGVYAGYYPADSQAAIAHLEALRAKGADFLLFPSTAFWWLTYYAAFRQHLELHYQRIRRDDSCVIYRIADRLAERAQRPAEPLDGVALPALQTSGQNSDSSDLPRNRLARGGQALAAARDASPAAQEQKHGRVSEFASRSRRVGKRGGAKQKANSKRKQHHAKAQAASC
jgi:hypothetical protein